MREFLFADSTGDAVGEAVTVVVSLTTAPTIVEGSAAET